MKNLISIKRKIYLIAIQGKVLLCLCFVFIRIVFKDDDFSALTAIKFINENIEKCTMMYRAAARNGIEFFFNNQTVLIVFLLLLVQTVCGIDLLSFNKILQCT